MQKQLDAQYWDDRHKDKNTPWCLGEVSPPLKNYFDQLEDKSKSILIPGAGHHYEAQYLMDCGFTDVTICDISSSAIENIKSILGTPPAIKYLNRDFFAIEDKYDLIIEQTFFCAIDPALRERLLAKISQILKPNGKWVGILFASEFQKPGPPFGGSLMKYKELIGKYLSINNISMCYNSVLPRRGNELFMICQNIKC